MNKSCKKMTAFLLSLALTTGNTVIILPNSTSLTTYAATASTPDVQGKDESYFDPETKTLHLKGSVNNSRNSTGVVLPRGVERSEVKQMIADKGTVLPENCSNFCSGLSRLSYIDLRNADASNVKESDTMFTNCRHLDRLILPPGWTPAYISENGAVTAPELPEEPVTEETEKDESYFDSKKHTLHLKGSVRNGADGAGIILPDDVKPGHVKNVTAEEGTVLPKDCSCLFKSLTSLESADLKNADTSEVTDMSYMFSSDGSLVSVDVSGFDTSNVKNMQGMFAGYKGSELDLSSFDTSNVTEMSSMFAGSGVRALDISRFDTSKVTDMSEMFKGCRFSELDTGSFNTSNVTDMSGMFSGCECLRELDLSSFDTSKVTDISSMFAECYGLKTLDVSSFDTSKVTKMNMLFAMCENLGSVDIGSFNTSNVTDMSSMFAFCEDIRSLDLSSFDTENVTNMSQMFTWCSDLRSLCLSSFDTSNVTDMSDMFSACRDLKEIDLGSFDTSNVTSMSRMFNYCGVSELELNNFDTSKVTEMYAMFSECSMLKELDLSSFDTSKVMSMREMFCNCSSLKTIYVSDKWETKQLSYYINKHLPSSVIHSYRLEDSTDMFTGCHDLTGEEGTVYDCSFTEADYAHIDTLDDPGYLTFKYDRNDFFKTQNLVLSGQIGVSFNLDLSSLTEEERDASYMEFKVNDRTSKDTFDKDSINESCKYYVFTCNVTSVEMADTITAVFHFGDECTVSKKYTVVDYIKKIEKDSDSYDAATLSLIRSIADFGHYSQPFLAAGNNWTVGKEHQPVDMYFTKSYSYETIKKEAGRYQRVLDLGKSDIENMTYSLSLDSGTALNIFIRPTKNYKGSIKVTAMKDSTETSYTAVKQKDGRYKVTIPNISAHQLGDAYTITASTTNGTATCTLSALSYVYAVLDGNSYDKTAKNAVSSLFKYYDDTIKYRKKA